MKPWTAEYGTFWAIELESGMPPALSVDFDVIFEEATTTDIPHLTTAMDLQDSSLVRERFQHGRRCFCFKQNGRILSFGWVTQGPEQVGEFERQFNLHPDETYIWHCGTISEWRRKGLYTTLLNNIIFTLAEEGHTSTSWIGASRLNQPSIQGIGHAGFKRVLDATYRRILFLTFIRFEESTSDHPTLIPDAYRIMLDSHDKLIGKVALGWYNGKI